MKNTRVKQHSRSVKGKGNSSVKSHKRAIKKTTPNGSPAKSNPATLRKSLKTKKPSSFKEVATNTLRNAVKVLPDNEGSQEQ